MTSLNDDNQDLSADAGDDAPQDGIVSLELPYELVEANLILLDISIDRSDIDPSELENQRLAIVHALREAIGVSDEDGQDGAAAVDSDGSQDDADADDADDADAEGVNGD